MVGVSVESIIHIEACSAVAIELTAGDVLRVIDVEGRQVADLFAFNRHDLDETLSNGRTFDYEKTLRLTKGHGLWSTKSRALLTIVDDPVGVHDFLYTPCSTEMFEIQYGMTDKTGCLEHLAAALAPYGVNASQITIPFNIFMNVEIDGASGGADRAAPTFGGGVVHRISGGDGSAGGGGGVCDDFR